jgi:hypothetical protein
MFSRFIFLNQCINKTALRRKTFAHNSREVYSRRPETLTNHQAHGITSKIAGAAQLRRYFDNRRFFVAQSELRAMRAIIYSTTQGLVIYRRARNRPAMTQANYR